MIKAFYRFALAISFAAVAQAAEITVFAAASLTDSLKAVTPLYEKHSGDTLRINLGASSTLARQIQEGAPADVFFSADEPKMDALAKANLIESDTRRSLLSNSLVIVIHQDATLAVSTPETLTNPEVRRLALAETKTVPAGIYARTYLESLGLWEKVKDKVVATDNVRACLAAVESGSAEAGIVYKTDAGISQKVKIAHEIPAADGPRIQYPVAVLAGSKVKDAANRLVAYLQTPEALAVFARFGFGVVGNH